MSHITEQLAYCEQSQETCAILLVDLDHFKRINDTWGYRAGDVLLRKVAARLRESLDVRDFVGRYGGEEFVIILPGVDIVEASQAAERLQRAVTSAPYRCSVDESEETISLMVTVSIGVVLYGLHGATRESLLEMAHQAVCRAKESGGNRVCLADVDEQAQQVGWPEQVAPADLPTLQALTAAASARDYNTYSHAQRLVFLAEATARKLQLPTEEIYHVRLGAMLHDIGKLGIPDAILHKPGPLTDEEWRIMRMHPEIGQNILMQAGGTFVTLGQIIAAHHERWDGQGYPMGLIGQQIPLVARILTVVDSFDAMISRRVYRNSLTIEEACAELRRCTGSQYDPGVVAAFLEMLGMYQHSIQELENTAPFFSSPSHPFGGGMKHIP